MKPAPLSALLLVPLVSLTDAWEACFDCRLMASILTYGNMDTSASEMPRQAPNRLGGRDKSGG